MAWACAGSELACGVVRCSDCSPCAKSSLLGMSVILNSDGPSLTARHVTQTSFCATDEMEVLLLVRSVQEHSTEHLRFRNHDACTVGFEQPVALGIAGEAFHDEFDVREWLLYVNPAIYAGRGLAHGEGRELMRIVLVTSAIGLAAWVTLMWVLGPVGVYIGFFSQMVLRTLGIFIAARKKWPIAIAWDGVVAGVLLTLVGFAATTL